MQVAEVTTQARGLSRVVPVGPEVGVDEPSIVNCDGVHTVSQRRLIRRVGIVDEDVFADIYTAIAIAFGCDTL